MKLAIYSFGCKVNQAEVEEWKMVLKDSFKLVDFNQKADVYIINTCSVTSKAAKESRQKIRQAKKQNKASLIVATGCLVNKKLPQIDFWVENSNKDQLPQILKEHLKIKKLLQTKTKFQDLTRALVKIQQGCDNFCSYCIVPFLRGQPVSISDQEIIQHIEELVRAGQQEIILVGTNIAKYNYQNSDLADLIQKILKHTQIRRLHLSSLWPSHLDMKLIDLFENPRLCPHVHLSLQNASNNILKKMGRDYTRQQVMKIIQQLRQTQPRINLTADVIVGFPGETANDFQQTYQFLKKIEFYKLHVFRYSIRPGTVAAKMEKQVLADLKKQRSLRLRKLDQEMRQIVVKNFLNTTVEVLFEKKVDGYWQGWTDNYIRAYLKSNQNLKNKLIQVQLVKNFKQGALALILG